MERKQLKGLTDQALHSAVKNWAQAPQPALQGVLLSWRSVSWQAGNKTCSFAIHNSNAPWCWNMCIFTDIYTKNEPRQDF